MGNNLAASGQDFCELRNDHMLGEHLDERPTFCRKSNLEQDFYKIFPHKMTQKQILLKDQDFGEDFATIKSGVSASRTGTKRQSPRQQSKNT